MFEVYNKDKDIRMILHDTSDYHLGIIHDTGDNHISSWKTT